MRHQWPVKIEGCCFTLVCLALMHVNQVLRIIVILDLHCCTPLDCWACFIQIVFVVWMAQVLVSENFFCLFLDVHCMLRSLQSIKLAQVLANVCACVVIFVEQWQRFFAMSMPWSCHHQVYNKFLIGVSIQENYMACVKDSCWLMTAHPQFLCFTDSFMLTDNGETGFGEVFLDCLRPLVLVLKLFGGGTHETIFIKYY